MSEEEVQPQTEENTTEYQTLAQGFLSPRHRRFAQLAAEGKSNKEIGELLGYVDSRVSVLLRNPHIMTEIRRLQDKIFEETVKDRLKTLNEPAINHMHKVLTDNTNRVKISEKTDVAKWVLEKTDGKAAQTYDVGQNLLGLLLDRLDAQKSQANGPPRDVTEVRALNEPIASAPPDELAEWVDDFSKQD